MRPLVSVIVPVYNAERYLAESINSALDQTYQNVEVIVVDDGSTDNSLQVAKSFLPRVQVISIPNSGACKARNVGLEMSKGDFIQFLDADDIITSDKFEKQLPYLINNQADLVFSNGTLFYEDGRNELIQNILSIKPPLDSDAFLFFQREGIGTNGPLHRRKLVEQVKGFTEGLSSGQETDFHMRLGIFSPRLLKIEDVTFHVRHFNNPNRLTRRPKEVGIMLRILLNVYNAYIQSGLRTGLRDKVLGGRLYQQSIYAFRNGAEDLASDGFRASRMLTSNPQFQERGWFKFVTKVIRNPIALERVLKILRRIKYGYVFRNNKVPN